MTEPNAFDAADAHDAAEASRLSQGEPAFTPGHFYFAHGDIADVFYCRIAPHRGLQFVLCRTDPLADSDEALESRSPFFGIDAAGRCYFAMPDGGFELMGWTPREFMPFGRTQMQWMVQLRETGQIRFGMPSTE